MKKELQTSLTRPNSFTLQNRYTKDICLFRINNHAAFFRLNIVYEVTLKDTTRKWGRKCRCLLAKAHPLWCLENASFSSYQKDWLQLQFFPFKSKNIFLSWNWGVFDFSVYSPLLFIFPHPLYPPLSPSSILLSLLVTLSEWNVLSSCLGRPSVIQQRLLLRDFLLRLVLNANTNSPRREREGRSRRGNRSKHTRVHKEKKRISEIRRNRIKSQGRNYFSHFKPKQRHFE